MLKQIAIVTSLIFVTGCAFAAGPGPVKPFKWVVGDAYIRECPVGAPPDCVAEVHGGTLSQGFDDLVKSTLGRAIDAVAGFFHVAMP